MNDVLSGVIITGYAIAGLFFLRFWRDTRDRFFAYFAGSFWLLCVQRLLLAIFRANGAENLAYLYLLRLIAFVIIALAIVEKNRPAKPAGSRDG
ncbi:MAG TPA: DUF5985 family protein [Gemmatimonadaceae bacterium]|nr:DUF5985 family protein [Gemmatimonadaceae bacterium]